MDIISYGKAAKTIREIKQLSEEVVGKEAESRFPTLDHRLDWLELQAEKASIESTLHVDIYKGSLSNIEIIEGAIKLKKIGVEEGVKEYTDTRSIPQRRDIVIGIPGEIVASGSSITFHGRTGYYRLTSGSYLQHYINGVRVYRQIHNHRSSYSYTRRLNSTHAGVNNITVQTHYGVVDEGSYNITLNVNYKDDIDVYFAKGQWESPIIDLGSGWYQTKLINIISSSPGNTNLLFEIATSSDGNIFSEYQELDIQAPPQARYVKLRASLSADSQSGNDKTLIFDQSDMENMLNLTDFVEADGQLKLKTYQEQTQKEYVDSEGGRVFEHPINLSDWKSVEKIEVN